MMKNNYFRVRGYFNVHYTYMFIYITPFLAGDWSLNIHVYLYHSLPSREWVIKYTCLSISLPS